MKQVLLCLLLFLLAGCATKETILVDGDVIPVDTYVTAWQPDTAHADDPAIKLRPGISIGLMDFKLPVGKLQLYVSSVSNPQIVDVYVYESSPWPLDLTWNTYQNLPLQGDLLDTFQVIGPQWYTVNLQGAQRIMLVAFGGSVEVSIASFNNPQASARPIAEAAPTSTPAPTRTPTATATTIHPTLQPTATPTMLQITPPGSSATPPWPPVIGTPTPYWKVRLILTAPDGTVTYLDLMGLEFSPEAK